MGEENRIKLIKELKGKYKEVLTTTGKLHKLFDHEELVGFQYDVYRPRTEDELDAMKAEEASEPGWHIGTFGSPEQCMKAIVNEDISEEALGGAKMTRSDFFVVASKEIDFYNLGLLCDAREEE